MIVCIGDLLIDVLVRRGAGGNAPAEQLSLTPGGAGANVASWLAYLGEPCGFVGAAGSDLAGDLLVADLRRRHIALAISRHAGAPSGMLLLETRADGAMRPAAQRGANDLLALDAEQRQLVERASWLHLSMYAFYAEISRGPLLRAIADAHARSVPVSLDLGAAHLLQHIGPEAYRGLLRRVAPDVLLANEEEASLLAGLPYDPRAPWEELDDDERQTIDARLATHVRTMRAAWEALSSYAPVAVLKRGADGCEVRGPDQRFTISVSLAIKPVDDTGAGDAFAAGFIAALHAGRSLREAARQGTTRGTQCVALVGGRPPLGGSHG